MSNLWLILFAVLAGGTAVVAQTPTEKKADAKTPPELGRVPFLRDYAAAVEQAKKEKKPLFVLFDEVPG